MAGQDLYIFFHKKQQDGIIDLLERSEYVKIKGAVENILGTKQSSLNAEMLAKSLVEIINDKGKVFFLEQLLKITGQVVRSSCDQVLREGLESLFSYGLSLTVSMEELAQLDLDKDQALALNVRTEMAVEAYLASLYRMSPKLVHDSESGVVRGQYSSSISKEELSEYPPEQPLSAGTHLRETGWGQAVITEIEQVVYTKVYGKPVSEPLDSFVLTKLDKTLVNRREIKGFEELHRVEAKLEAGSDHPLCDENICKLLKSPEHLPNLPIVLYGSQEGYTGEAKISALVDDFFELLNRYT